MDQQLDRAIDEVAREMTAAEPPSALRAEVLARIERERARRAGGLFLPRWAWAGVAAVLVLGTATTLWLTRTGPAPNQQASMTAPGPAAQPAPTRPGTLATAPASPSVDTMIASAQPASGPRAALPVAVAQPVGLPDDAGPAALAGPDALDIAPLGPAAIAVSSLGVGALVDIEPITVSTIGPGSLEPQRRDRE
jgi:hypothetical protein